MKPGSCLRGIGSCIPTRIMTNVDFEKMVDTTDEWIRTRTGIQLRHMCNDDEYTSIIATRAARLALERAGLSGQDLDMIICSTISPDQPLPSTACIIQNNLGANHGVAFDLAAACSGFLYGLKVADQFIRTGTYKNILVIGVEVLSRWIDFQDRATCVLFGDGAGAAVVSPADSDSGILASEIRSDGSMADVLLIPGGGTRHPASYKTIDERMHYVRMRGNELFKVAVKSMSEISRKLLADTGTSIDTIDWFIPHQANQRISDAVRDRLEMPPEKVYCNIDHIGNTSSASIPIALDELYSQGKLKKGMKLLLTSFGAGVTWGAALVRW